MSHRGNSQSQVSTHSTKPEQKKMWTVQFRQMHQQNRYYCVKNGKSSIYRWYNLNKSKPHTMSINIARKGLRSALQTRCQTHLGQEGMRDGLGIKGKPKERASGEGWGGRLQNGHSLSFRNFLPGNFLSQCPTTCSQKREVKARVASHS